MTWLPPSSLPEAPELIVPPPVPPLPPPPPAGPNYSLEPNPGEPDPEELPARRRVRLVPRSLTARLVSGVVALVFVLVCLTGAGTYLALKSELQNRLDQQLQSTASNSLSTMRVLFSTPPADTGLRSPQNVWVTVIGQDGTVLGYPSSPNINVMNLSSAQRTRLALRTSPSPITVTTTDGTELRVTARSISAGNVPGTALLGLSTDEEHRTLHQLINLELLIGASALVVALVATGYGVSFSLRRLRRVTSTAQEVAAELSPEGAGLDRRVPFAEEGTEVGALAESMNTLLSAVETQFAARVESEKRMRQFLADASHELRTPLTSIRGYAELARMQRAAGNPDEDNLGRIEAEGTRMSRLVEDLLMLARGDQDAIPRTELVDVAELLDDAVSGSRAAFPERVIDLEPVASYHVVGDPDQLVRAVRNLIGNAAVHTNPDAPIRIRAFVDGPGIAIQVIDGGPGLPPDEAQHVFERFWRADKARTRARGGTGLGLSIVATIVAAHAGTVHFASTVEQGSTITIWLPGVVS